MNEALLIHFDNTPLVTRVADSIKFNPSMEDLNNSDIDTFISKQIIPKIQEKNFKVIIIKDTLSENYIDFYGLVLSYHIRLSSNILGDKSFSPIIILSDINEFIINKLTNYGKILFTKNTFLVENSIDSIEDVKFLNFQLLNKNEFEEQFTNKISIEPPQDYLSHHSIANEWSIYNWANILNVKSDVITKNQTDIENMLYFKYLNALTEQKEKKQFKIKKVPKKPKGKGKILFIDDEWNKGWSDILNKVISKDGIEFKTFEYDFNDKTKFNLYMKIQKEIIDFKPDLVVLDLRLAQSDHEDDNINNYTGVKILEKIHEINAGIQIIMLTATSKSTTLERLYEKKILGYIKKEHPNDVMLNTIDNINKLVDLVDKGFEKKYLIKVWNIQASILSLNVFKTQNNIYKKILFEVSNIFNILDSNLEKKVTFFVLAVYNIIEIIVKDFGYKEGSAFKNIINICNEKLNLYGFDEKLSQLICTRNYLIHLDDDIKYHCKDNTIKKPTNENIVEWFNMIDVILKGFNQVK